MQVTRKALAKLSKYELAAQHARNGGIMGLATYSKWTKDELVNAVLEDNGIDPWTGQPKAGA